MSSAGEICHKCRRTGSITPSLSGELLCPNCHSELEFPNRSPPRSTPSPIASPPTPLPQPRYHFSFSGNNFAAPTITLLSPVLDQEPASGHLRNFLNLDVDAVLIEQLVGIDPHRHETPPAARSAVEALADVKVDAEISQSDCAVCKVGFDYGIEVKQMPCNHFYHNDCILPWLNLHNTCPTCRFELPTDDPIYENESNSVSSDDSIGSGSSENPSGSGSENPAVESPGVSGSENQAVSDYENIGGSGSVPGSGLGA